MSQNPIYLDHCYYKDYPSNTNENDKTIINLRNALSTGMQHIIKK